MLAYPSPDTFCAYWFSRTLVLGLAAYLANFESGKNKISAPEFLVV